MKAVLTMVSAAALLTVTACSSNPGYNMGAGAGGGAAMGAAIGCLATIPVGCLPGAAAGAAIGAGTGAVAGVASTNPYGPPAPGMPQPYYDVPPQVVYQAPPPPPPPVYAPAPLPQQEAPYYQPGVPLSEQY